MTLVPQGQDLGVLAPVTHRQQPQQSQSVGQASRSTATDHLRGAGRIEHHRGPVAETSPSDQARAPVIEIAMNRADEVSAPAPPRRR
jgi:hypothetical protein